jgi:hypothetical protein
MANKTCPLRGTKYYCSSDCAWYSEIVGGCSVIDRELRIEGLSSLLEKLDDVIKIQQETAKGFKKVSTLAKKKTKGK